jgi:hypothetical protein
VSAESNNAFNVQWKHNNKSGQYAYTLSYTCADGVSVKAPVPTGAYQAVDCNTPFNFINASSSMPLIVTAGKTTPVVFSIASTKLSNGLVTASSTSSINVTKTAVAGTKTTKPATKPSAPATTYVPSGRMTNLYGYADLAVTVLSSVNNGSRTTIQFQVINAGTNVSPANWSLEAHLPIQGGYTYPSGGQRALYPGDKVVYTLTFDNYSYTSQPCGVTTYSYGYGYVTPCTTQDYGGGYYSNAYGQHSVTIQVDPYNYVTEVTKANNYATATY